MGIALAFKSLTIAAQTNGIRRAAPRVLGTIMAAVALVLALAGAALFQLRAYTFQDRSNDASAAVRLVEEHAEKVIGSNLAVLDQLVWLVRDVGWDQAASSVPLHERLRRLVEARPELQSAWLIDADGKVRASSIAFPPPTANVADRDYFVALRNGETDFIGAVVFGRVTKEHIFNVARRIEDGQGNFLGLVLVSIYPSYFEQVYGMVGPEADVVMLLRADGKLLARYPRPEGDPDTLAAPASFMARLIGRQGTFTAASPFVTDDYLYAYRRLGTLPLYVTYGIRVTTIEAAWRHIVRNYALFGVPALLALGVFGALAFREARTVDRARAELERRVVARTESLSKALVEKNKALADKDVLMRELQHRVKNNLQMISSLVRMSARKASPDAQPVLGDLARRVWAIGQIHTRIYAANISALDFADYIKALCENMAETEINRPVKLAFSLQPITVDLENAVPVALILVELITNAYKYAFPDNRAGTIAVTLARQGDCAVLTVSDDGAGIDADKKGGTGLQLAQMLAQQVNGRFDQVGGAGTTFALTFPLRPARPR